MRILAESSEADMASIGEATWQEAAMAPFAHHLQQPQTAHRLIAVTEQCVPMHCCVIPLLAVSTVLSVGVCLATTCVTGVLLAYERSK